MKEEIDVEPVECRDTGEIVGTYSDYLETKHWKRFRSKFLREKKNRICFICGDTPKSIHLHHKTYKRLGNEKISDIVSLCQSCHQEIHFFLLKTTSKKVDLWNAVEVYKKRYWKRDKDLQKRRGTKLRKKV